MISPELTRYGTDYHQPVMYREVMEHLVVNPDGVYLDSTLGGGGHSAAILDQLSPNGSVIGVDRDPDAIQRASERLSGDARFQAVQCRFHEFFEFYPEYAANALDGVLIDLGVSSYQLDRKERGFSYRFSGPLDMRMNPEDALNAEEVVNGYEPRLLEQIFRDYGDLGNAPRLANAIVQARLDTQITRTDQLVKILSPLFPVRQRNKLLSRAFQAIRIEVNQELHALKHMLVKSHDALKPGGRLVVIAYHSAEDRLVKEFMRFAESDCVCHPDAPVCTCDKQQTLKLPVRKAIKASEEEQRQNPRSRSARLRVGIRVTGG